MTGDGDALSIGGNHLIHALRRNVNLTILLFNNRIYGLTKGQYSPTSERGKVTKSTPLGSVDQPFNPLSVAIGAEATFVARAIDTDKQGTAEVLRAAAAHRGAAFVEILQNCNIYNDGAFDVVREEKENRLYLQAGEEVRWGDRGVRMRPDGTLEVVDALGRRPTRHDPGRDDPGLAFALARLTWETAGACRSASSARSSGPSTTTSCTSRCAASAEQQGRGRPRRRCSTAATPGRSPSCGGSARAAEKPLVRGARSGARGCPEVVAERTAEPLVDETASASFPLPRERLHEQAIPALPIGRELDETAGVSTRCSDLRAPDTETRARVALERPQVDVLEPASPLVDPCRLLAGKEGTPRDLERDRARPPRRGASPGRARRPRPRGPW